MLNTWRKRGWFQKRSTSLIYKNGFIRMSYWSTTFDMGGGSQKNLTTRTPPKRFHRLYLVFWTVCPLPPKRVWKRSNHWCGDRLREWNGTVKCPPFDRPPVQDFLNGFLNTPQHSSKDGTSGYIRDRQLLVHYWCWGCSNTVWTVWWVYPSKDFFVLYVNSPLNG